MNILFKNFILEKPIVLNYYNINVPCKDEETASKSLKKLNYDLIKRLKMEVK